jgi:hypothetical protein
MVWNVANFFDWFKFFWLYIVAPVFTLLQLKVAVGLDSMHLPLILFNKIWGYSLYISHILHIDDIWFISNFSIPLCHKQASDVIGCLGGGVCVCVCIRRGVNCSLLPFLEQKGLILTMLVCSLTYSELPYCFSLLGYCFKSGHLHSALQVSVI